MALDLSGFLSGTESFRKIPAGQPIFSKLHYTWTSGAPTGPTSGGQSLGCKLLRR